MIKYRTKEWRGVPDAKILKIECSKETEKSVWINNGRHLKITDNEIYHDTWKEAYSHILTLANEHVIRVAAQLDKAHSLLNNIVDLKEE